MSYTCVIEDIENLPRFREFMCPVCGHAQKTYVLLIQTQCENCRERLKLRGLASIGSEIEDVIDTVLVWLGEREEFDLALKWKQILDQHEDTYAPPE